MVLIVFIGFVSLQIENTSLILTVTLRSSQRFSSWKFLAEYMTVPYAAMDAESNRPKTLLATLGTVHPTNLASTSSRDPERNHFGTGDLMRSC